MVTPARVTSARARDAAEERAGRRVRPLRNAGVRKVSAAAFLGLTTSCALIGGLDDYYVRQEGGDASVPADALPLESAVADVDTVDAADAAEASLDGGIDDVSQPRGCARYPDAAFCDDFDVPPLGQRWDGSSTTMGSLTLGTNAPFSPPSFLEATVGAVSQNGYGPRLVKNLGARTAITLSARVRIEPSKSITPLRLDVQTAQSHDIRLTHFDGGTHIEEVNYTLTQSNMGPALAKTLDDTFQEVTITVSFTARTVDVMIGGVPALVGQSLTVGDWTGTATVSLYAGLPFVVTQAAPVTSGLDDIVVFP